jgi:hypothetical protein
MVDSTRTEAPPKQESAITYVPLAAIDLESGITARVETSDATIAEYAERMAAADPFPPVILFTENDTTYWLADGVHRVWAARQCGRADIIAEVRHGGRKAALEYAVGANATHGLPRTNADKRNAVMMYLDSFPTNKPQARKIAAVCKVSHTFVHTILAERAGEKAERRKRQRAEAKTEDSPSKSVNVYKDDSRDIVQPDTGPEEQSHEHTASPEQQPESSVEVAEEGTETDGVETAREPVITRQNPVPTRQERATSGRMAQSPPVPRSVVGSIEWALDQVPINIKDIEGWWQHVPDGLKWAIFEYVKDWAKHTGTKLSNGGQS